jgi:hypothetical protein
MYTGLRTIVTFEKVLVAQQKILPSAMAAVLVITGTTPSHYLLCPTTIQPANQAVPPRTALKFPNDVRSVVCSRIGA